MKRQFLWVCVCGAVALAAALPAPIAVAPAITVAVSDPIAAAAAAVLTAPKTSSAEAESSASAADARTKRSHGLLGLIANKVTGKIGSLSAASSGHSEPEYHVEYPPVTSFGHKSFDLWGFKKALLGTLLQAVKAIKGGLIALKGQLIKAKGHILTTKGNLIKAKGEAITDFGRHIATKALWPKPTAHTAPSSSYTYSAPGYLPPHTYYGPPPSAPSVQYGVPYLAPYARSAPSAATATAKGGALATGRGNGGGEIKLPEGVQAGLLILKPLKGGVPAAAGLLHDASEPVPAIAPAPATASGNGADFFTIQRSLDFDTPPDFGGYFHAL